MNDVAAEWPLEMVWNYVALKRAVWSLLSDVSKFSVSRVV